MRSVHSYPCHEMFCENEQLKVFLKLKPKWETIFLGRQVQNTKKKKSKLCQLFFFSFCFISFQGMSADHKRKDKRGRNNKKKLQPMFDCTYPVETY